MGKMKEKNHCRMGVKIHSFLKENNLPLRKLPFVFGNVAPDLTFSYVYCRHEYTYNSQLLYRLLIRAYRTRSPFLLSYRLGKISHYICDYFCFSHCLAFKGSLKDHMIYEDCQTVNNDDLLPFSSNEIEQIDMEEMISKLECYIDEREADLSKDPSLSYMDIPLAIYMATWAASAVAWPALSENPNPADNIGDCILTVSTTKT